MCRASTEIETLRKCENERGTNQKLNEECFFRLLNNANWTQLTQELQV